MSQPKYRNKEMIAQYAWQPELGGNEQTDGGMFFGHTVHEPTRGLLVGLALGVYVFVSFAG